MCGVAVSDAQREHFHGQLYANNPHSKYAWPCSACERELLEQPTHALCNCNVNVRSRDHVCVAAGWQASQQEGGKQVELLNSAAILATVLCSFSLASPPLNICSVIIIR